MKKYTGVIIGLLAAGIGTFLLLKNKSGSALTADQQRQYLKDWAASVAGSNPDAATAFNNVIDLMSPEEVGAVYSYVHDFIQTGQTLPDGPLKDQIAAISTKYNIFT